MLSGCEITRHFLHRRTLASASAAGCCTSETQPKTHIGMTCQRGSNLSRITSSQKILQQQVLLAHHNVFSRWAHGTHQTLARMSQWQSVLWKGYEY